jgi:YD repeat-containing protein
VSTANNGQVCQTNNYVVGEEVLYHYDALRRLTSAATTGAEWGLSFTYDGFGNLTQQTVTKGSAPPLSVAVNASTNRIVGQAYDANGNLTAINGITLTYDVENRLLSTSNGESYWYSIDNRRVWRREGDRGRSQ